MLLNHSDQNAEVPIAEGSILIGTDRSRDGRRVDGSVELSPWEAVVVGPPAG